MTHPDQLHHLQVNAQTQEPFLPLRRHKNIILTPMRWEDARQFLPIFNDPRVYLWLRRPKVPYLLEDAEKWLKEYKPRCDAVLQELKEAQGSSELKLVENCPVAAIREVQEDGSDILLGNITTERCIDGVLLDADPSNWPAAEAKIGAMALGDPEIVWTIGNYLAATHHGQGIMSDAVETLMLEWMVPRMGARVVRVGAFEDNVGSQRVFEKNGFVRVRGVKDYTFSVVRNEMRSIQILEYTHHS